jgi:hypothetical protein
MKLPEITLASSVRYGNYKEHYYNALFLSDILKEKYDEIKEFIDLPKYINIVFRPIRSAYGRAFYLKTDAPRRNRNYVVELDVRQDIETFKNTLIHELVHIEQFYQGRLIDAGPMHFKWNGKKTLINTASLDAYNNLPWEIEANVRAEMVSSVVFT